MYIKKQGIKRLRNMPTVSQVVNDAPGSHGLPILLQHNRSCWSYPALPARVPTLEEVSKTLPVWDNLYILQSLTHCQLLFFWPLVWLPHSNKWFSGCCVIPSLGADFLFNPQALISGYQISPMCLFSGNQWLHLVWTLVSSWASHSWPLYPRNSELQCTVSQSAGDHNCTIQSLRARE